MAEPGAPWQATDVIVKRSLPFRRLQSVALKNPAAFQIAAATSAIPASVRTALPLIFGEKLSMAEPGAPWQSTDVIVQPSLPIRRLQSIALSKGFCIVFYEQGGFVHTHRVAIFRLADKQATVAWTGEFAPGAAVDPASLLQAVETGQGADDPRVAR